ncbi:MAG: glycosyltransferase family 2 protein [Desulfurococcaceae archaeon]
MVSLIVLARRFLGRRGTFLLRTVLSELTYRMGFFYEYADSVGRKNGISAVMCLYNEEDWVKPAMLSLKELVDEYVVVDSSSDRTPLIVREVAEEHGLNLKLIRIPPGSLAEAKLTGLKNSSYKWILFHDGDMVLYEWAPKIIHEVVESLNPRRHYLVYWKYLLMCGDVHHVCGDEPYHIEHWLVTYSQKLKYKYLDYGGGVYMETLIAPLRLYKPILVDRVLGVHLAYVRSPEKIALKHIRLQYRKRLLEYTSSGVSAEEAVVRIAREVYNAQSLRELGERLIKDMVSKLPRYDEAKHGPLPRVLLDYLKKEIT